jgi:predicted alpha/beta-fold hydrolase
MNFLTNCASSLFNGAVNVIGGSLNASASISSKDTYEFSSPKVSAEITGEALGYTIGVIASTPIQNAIMPLVGAPFQGIYKNWTPRSLRNYVIQELKTGETVSIPSHDGTKLDAVWAPAKNSEKAPTVILIHGNGFTLDGMVSRAKWYTPKDINILMYTIRGYPGSGGSDTASELNCYKDCAAVVDFAIKDKGVNRERLFLHGYSLGGAIAAGAARGLDLPVTLDHTFSTYGEAIVSVVTSRLPTTLTPVIRGVAKGALPNIKRESSKKLEEKSTFVASTEPFVADGFNTLEKMKGFKKPVFIISGKEDNITPARLGELIYEGRYGEAPTELDEEAYLKYNKQKNRRFVVMEGGHEGQFPASSQVTNKYDNYLIKNNLVDTDEDDFHVVEQD